jgi:hypothetical protein
MFWPAAAGKLLFIPLRGSLTLSGPTIPKVAEGRFRGEIVTKPSAMYNYVIH